MVWGWISKLWFLRGRGPMQVRLLRSVRIYVFVSRVVFFAIGALSNYLLEDHRPTDVFRAPGLNFTSNRSLENAVYTAFGGLVRWDAHHFFHIAQAGYTYDNNLPFFPMFPKVVGTLAYLIHFLLPEIEIAAKLLLVAIVVNLFCFLKATEALYHLTCKITDDSNFAYRTAVFFCLSPATVFFIAPYSESMFSYFVFSGMLCCIEGEFGEGTLWFALSGIVRSNGMLNYLFVVYFLLFRVCQFYCSGELSLLRFIYLLIIACLFLIVSAFIIFAPFATYQMYGYSTFCSPVNNYILPEEIMKYGIDNNLIMPSNKSDWCNIQLPFPYFKIQEKYWNVGFLNYFQLKQVPNFVLAFPMVYLVLVMGFRFVKKSLHFLWKARGPPTGSKLLPHASLPFCIHAVLLTIYAFFFINVQVTTRLIASSSPFIYWVAATHFVTKSKKKPGFFRVFPFSAGLVRSSSGWIRYYFLTYIFAGLVLFCNDLPWT